jgi:hypothetical protein
MPRFSQFSHKEELQNNHYETIFKFGLKNHNKNSDDSNTYTTNNKYSHEWNFAIKNLKNFDITLGHTHVNEPLSKIPSSKANVVIQYLFRGGSKPITTFKMNVMKPIDIFTSTLYEDKDFDYISLQDKREIINLLSKYQFVKEGFAIKSKEANYAYKYRTVVTDAFHDYCSQFKFPFDNTEFPDIYSKFMYDTISTGPNKWPDDYKDDIGFQIVYLISKAFKLNSIQTKMFCVIINHGNDAEIHKKLLNSSSKLSKEYKHMINKISNYQYSDCYTTIGDQSYSVVTEDLVNYLNEYYTNKKDKLLCSYVISILEGGNIKLKDWDFARLAIANLFSVARC